MTGGGTVQVQVEGRTGPEGGTMEAWRAPAMPLKGICGEQGLKGYYGA